MEPCCDLQHWEAVLEKIAEDCEKSDRDIDELLVLPVTKGFDYQLVRTAWEFGFRTFGENRVAEYLEKRQALSEHPAASANWHMVGHLQSKKVKKIIGEFDLIHSFDRHSLVDEFNRRQTANDPVQKILLQVNISGENSKYGIEPEKAPALLEAVLNSEHLWPVGLMTMAPWTDDKSVIRKTFAGCRTLRDGLAEKFDIALPELSMGMTNDYQIAIKEDATILRLGRLFFGERD